MLKKFTVEQIKEMRELKRLGWGLEGIAQKFNCATTTASWHTADIKNNSTVEIT